MMAKDRDQRYQTFTDVLQDLYKLKRREVTSAQLSGNAPQPRRQQRFQECFVPSDLDILVGQIALHNKLTNIGKLEECLIRQESLALMGIYLTLSDIMSELQLISPQQKIALDRAKLQYALDRGDEIFLKVCNSNNFLDHAELVELQKFRKARYKGLGGLMLSHRILKNKKQEKIFASVKHAISGEEGKLLLKTALENNIISKPQAEKCSRIYTNNVVMGKYKDIGDILVEKGFVPLEAF